MSPTMNSLRANFQNQIAQQQFASQQQQGAPSGCYNDLGNIIPYSGSGGSGLVQPIARINPQLEDYSVKQQNKKENSMFGTISQDLKKFIVEHKSTIYVLAVLILADHLLFQGQFRDRLHKMMNTLLGKVENMIEKKHE